MNDVRFAFRQLLKNPGFTAVAVMTLALGIGANTAIFSVVNGVLLTPLPYRAPEELIRIYQSNPSTPKFPISAGAFQDYREQNSTLAGLALYTREDVELSKDFHPERLSALRITSGFFDVLGAHPLLGREFNREDEVPGNSRVAILSHNLWRRRFNADPGIIGSSVALSGEAFTVVGVMPPGVQHVGGDYRSMPHGDSVDLWWPITLRPQDDRYSHYMNAVGRLRTGIRPEQARAEFNTIADRLSRQFPDSDQGWHISVCPLLDEIVGSSRATLLVLFGAVIFVLLIACVNVANLFIARSSAREREIAVRVAIGARGSRIVRQLLTESLLLAAISSAAGILLAKCLIAALGALGPEQLPRLQAVSLDWRVLLFTLVLTLMSGILFGLVPALQTGKIDINGSLRKGGRSGSAGRSSRLRDLLIVTEVAAALLLLAGTGLLVRSFWNLQQTDRGFNPERIVTAKLSLPAARYAENPKIVNFQRTLLDRLAALPAVESVGLTSDLPWSGYDENAGFTIEGRSFPPNDDPGGRYHFVSDDYFRMVGVPLLAGRYLTADDKIGKPRVVLINRSLAQRYWRDGSAIGKRITFNPKPNEEDWLTIVGIVGDVKDAPNSTSAVPAFYWPLSQVPFRDVILALRTRASFADTIKVTREEVAKLDKDLALAAVTTLDTLTTSAVAAQRFTLILFVSFAGTALALAAIGIYGVLSYLVAQRTREIGVRIALGAAKHEVIWLTFRQGMQPALIGVAIGLASAFALTRLMTGLLYEVGATDLGTFSLSALLLTLVAMVPCWLPALRATRVDPMVALRYE